MVISRIFNFGSQHRLERKLPGWKYSDINFLARQIMSLSPCSRELISCPREGRRVALSQLTNELELSALLCRSRMTDHIILHRLFSSLAGIDRERRGIPADGLKLEEAYGRLAPQLAIESKTREETGNKLADENKCRAAANEYFAAARSASQPDRAKRLWLSAAENHLKAGGQAELQKAAYAYCNAAKLSEREDRILFWVLAADNHEAGGQPREAGYAREMAAKQALGFEDQGHQLRAKELLGEACKNYDRAEDNQAAAYCYAAKASLHDGSSARHLWLAAADRWLRLAEIDQTNKQKACQQAAQAYVAAARCSSGEMRIKLLTAAAGYFRQGGRPDSAAEIERLR